MSKITIPIELELSPRSRAVMNAIGRALDPRFVDLSDGTAEEQPPTSRFKFELPAKPGTHMPNERAWYAGPLMTPTGELRHILVPEAHLKTLQNMRWGKQDTEVEGCADMYDGLANTEAMARAGNELAKRVQFLDEGLYLPSRAEALLMFSTLKSVIGEEASWTSTQCSAGGAWCQDFNDGNQYVNDKCCELRAVPVRRLFL